MIKVYSTGCPKCVALEEMLEKNEIPYEKCSDLSPLKELNITSLPVMQVKNQYFDYVNAVKYILRNKGAMKNGD